MTTQVDDTVSAAFTAHAGAVYGAALRATRDPDLAADVMQDAFVRLLLEARAGRYPEHVVGWLHRTSTNLVVSRARRESVARRHAPLLVEFGAASAPEAVVIRREEDAALRAALAHLSTGDRRVLLMAASGLSADEMARRLGRTPGASRTALCRARARLHAAATA